MFPIPVDLMRVLLLRLLLVLAAAALIALAGHFLL